jgi:outer membrane lipoprotein-sorting protein
MKLSLLSVLLVLTALPGWSAESVEKIFEKARAVNPGLQDSTAEMSVQINAVLGFIPYKTSATGKYYHKQPDKNKLDLEKAPSWLKKYPQVFGYKLPDLTRYNVLKIQESELRGNPVYRIQLVPKQRTNDITNIDIYFNREDYSVPKFDTFYTKGHLYVDMDYTKSGKFVVCDKLSADFEFPNITATASANYSNYVFNQNLPDSMFAGK